MCGARRYGGGSGDVVSLIFKSGAGRRFIKRPPSRPGSSILGGKLLYRRWKKSGSSAELRIRGLPTRSTIIIPTMTPSPYGFKLCNSFCLIIVDLRCTNLGKINIFLKHIKLASFFPPFNNLSPLYYLFNFLLP